FCSDEEGLEKKLKELADKEKLKEVILTLDNPAGPKAYKVAKDADVTVVLYVKGGIKANYAFKKGELKDSDIEKIVADLSKILPEKKSHPRRRFLSPDSEPLNPPPGTRALAAWCFFGSTV